MKIDFVGTSHGAPSATRHCMCIMIESGEALYFIDAGAPMAQAVLRYGKPMSSLRAVFTTHCHSDHVSGLANLAGLINWFYVDTEADIFVTDEKYIEAIKVIMEAGGDGAPDQKRVRFKVPSAGIVYEDENIQVEYIPTKHSSKCESYAILVTEGEKRVLFGGDFSQDLKRDDVPCIIKEELDGFVCELAHFSLAQLRPYLDVCKTKKLFFTHVYPLSKYDEIEAVKGEYDFEIFSPCDNDIFEI